VIPPTVASLPARKSLPQKPPSVSAGKRESGEESGERGRTVAEKDGWVGRAVRENLNWPPCCCYLSLAAAATHFTAPPARSLHHFGVFRVSSESVVKTCGGIKTWDLHLAHTARALMAQWITERKRELVVCYIHKIIRKCTKVMSYIILLFVRKSFYCKPSNNSNN